MHLCLPKTLHPYLPKVLHFCLPKTLHSYLPKVLHYCCRKLCIPIYRKLCISIYCLHHGEEVLEWKKKYDKSIHQKIDLVLAYRESNLSLSQAAAQFGLAGPGALTTWNNLMKEDKQLTPTSSRTK